jgi:hypothetical protein
MVPTPVEFTKENLAGARFESVTLADARPREVDLSGSRFHNVNMSGVVIRGAWFVDVEMSGDVENAILNGVDVAPLVEAELDRRHPDRAKMRPTDAAGYCEAWDLLERLWEGTVERARRLPPEALHESVEGEWSFIQTLRHLAFATDAWVSRAYRVPRKPVAVASARPAHDEMPDLPGVPRDLGAKPSLEEVLALRADRQATVRRDLAELTDECFAESTTPVLEPGYPAAESFPVPRCLRCILSEEWHHRLFAERDLAGRAGGPGDRSCRPCVHLTRRLGGRLPGLAHGGAGAAQRPTPAGARPAASWSGSAPTCPTRPPDCRRCTGHNGKAGTRSPA